MLFGFWYPAMLSRDLRAERSAPPRCSSCRWPLDATRRGAPSRLPICARIARCRFRLGAWPPTRSSAAITGGNLTRTRDNAAPSRRLPPMPTSRSSASLPKAMNAPSATATSGFSFPIPPRKLATHGIRLLPTPKPRIISQTASQNNDRRRLSRAARFQRALPHHPRQRRVSLRRRSGSARAARSRAWTLRAPVVVLALVAQFARQAKNL